MSKMKYIIRDSNELNLNFYKRYDENFLMNKAMTLMFIADHRDQFKKFVKDIDGTDEDLDDKYFEALRAEIYFTESHQFESLFALMMAMFQKLPHWLYLTTYKTGEIKKSLKYFIDGDIEALTSGKIRKVNEFISLTIYANFVTDEEDKRKRWDENLDNIYWALKRIGERYLENKEFNAYKHGLRIMTGHSQFVIYPHKKPERAICLGESEDSLSFLELKDVGEGGLTVYETTKHISPIESFNHLFIMHLLLETIKSTRLARIKKEPGAKIKTLFELDREKLIYMGKRTSFSFAA